MKKILILAIMAPLSFGAKAQIQIGGQVGGLLSSISLKDDVGAKQSGGKSLFGFKVGVVAKIPIIKSIAFMPELNFVEKGGKFDSSGLDLGTPFSVKVKFTPMFIELPLNFAYTMKAGPGTFFAGLGPVLSYGISGKANLDATFDGSPSPDNGDHDIKFDGKKQADLSPTDNDYHLKALEFGADIFAGYQLSNGIFAKIMYNQGFSNLAVQETNDKSSFKTSYVGVAAGFMFGGKEKKK